MRRTGSLLLAVVCMCFLSGCGKDQETLDQQLKLRSQGMEQALEGNYEEALTSYNEALKLAGMRAGELELDIAAYKASALYRSGELEKAVDTCTAILELKESAEIYLTRGLLYREAGDEESAAKDFALALERTSEKDLVMLGKLALYRKDYQESKKYLEQAYEAGDQEALYWQAELYWEMGNEDYAVSLYQSYLAEGEARQTVYEKVASYQIRQEDYDGALETLESGIALGDSGSLPELLSMEIAVYEQKSDFETAKIKMESYLELYPEDEAAVREYEFLKTR